MNRFLTVNAGVRWEQERVAGTVLSYVFSGNWSPRIGVNFDPFADRKGKIFFNYGRNFWAMPLDAANRQLGNEQDDTSYAFAPVIQNGALVIVPDDAHNLNGMDKGPPAPYRSHIEVQRPEASLPQPVKASYPEPKPSMRMKWSLALNAKSRTA